MPRLVFYPIADSYLLVAAVAIVLVGLLAVGPRRGAIAPRRRLWLTLLRAAVVLLVLSAMLRPTLVTTETRLQPATLVVLADTSRSMTVPDALGGRKTRYEAMVVALDSARDNLAALARQFEVKTYAFDAETRPIKLDNGFLALPKTPAGRQTAIGAALDDAMRLEAGKRLLGVVLLGDGAQRAYAPRDLPPQTAAAALARLGGTLWTVSFGQSRGLGQAKDAAVTQLVVDENVFAKNELSVAAQIRADGFVNRDLPVRLLFETAPGRMQVVAQQILKPTSDGQLLPVALSHVPEAPGQYKLTVEVPDQPGELVTTNNRMSTFVNVLAGGLNVLAIEGWPPRKEAGALRRALDASPDIDVDYLGLSVKSAPADLDERLRPGRYMVYILGDVPADAFTEDQLTALAAAVDRGAGLLALGGFHAFGPGGYADTPLAGVLPLRMSRLETQRPGEPIRPDAHLEGPLRIQPSDLGRRHFAMMLAADPNAGARIWEQLPPLDGANRFDPAQLKPGALVLATDQEDRPLLVAQAAGAGRVIAFAGDTTWRWPMRGFAEVHNRFWRQVVLWLARKDESQQGQVWVRLSRRRLEPGGRLEVTAGANSPTGEPVEEATLEAEVTLPDGATRPLRLSQGDKTATASFSDIRAAGDYAVTVRASKDGKPLGQSRGRFLVFEENVELDNASADPTGMESLAAMTGAHSVDPQRLPELLEQIGKQTEKLEEKIETKQTYWDTWPFLLALVALLTLEWYLRKRWGLV